MAKETILNKVLAEELDELVSRYETDEHEGLADLMFEKHQLMRRHVRGDKSALVEKALKSPAVQNVVREIVGVLVDSLKERLELSDEGSDWE